MTNSIYGYQQKQQKKKKDQGGKETRKKKGRKKYDDFSKPGLPDFVSGLLPKLHVIPYYSNTKSSVFEDSFW